LNDDRKPVGSVLWLDLTVPAAEEIRDFYAAVVGWKPEPLSMGDYDDYMMLTPDGGEIGNSGVCHARGENADLPPYWMAYIAVADLEASVRQCEERGGTVISGPKGDAEHGRFCVIRDPAGAVLALMQQP
jgi:uncharacterized protein